MGAIYRSVRVLKVQGSGLLMIATVLCHGRFVVLDVQARSVLDSLLLVEVSRVALPVAH